MAKGEGGGGGGGVDVEPATRAAGGMCDRFLTFLAKNLSVSRMKSIADGPRNNTGAGAGHPPPPTEGGGDGDGGGVEEEDEFAIPIERAEFDFQLGGGGHGDGAHGSAVAPTILEESTATTATATATATRDVPGEQKDGAAAVEEEMKVRRTVTIKDDRPGAQEAAGGASAMATAPTVERKKSLFRKRQLSSIGAAGEEQGRVPRRSGLRPRMPPVPKVPSNINQRSSTFIEERKKSFGSGGGKPVPEK